MANKPKNLKPSDFSLFCMQVYQASATLLEFDEYMDYYGEILKVLWWNPDVDTPLALAADPNPSGVVFGGNHG